MALEYYLDVVDHGLSVEEDEGSEEDEDKDKKKKDKEDCKQQ
jgi:hypothetical protein